MCQKVLLKLGPKNFKQFKFLIYFIKANTVIFQTTFYQCFGSGWIWVFSPIRIRVLKVQIRPLVNLQDLNDGFDKVLEEPDQKGQC